MADKKKTRNIMCTVTDIEYNEILMYARLKGHGGENPVPNLVHYAVFQHMRRYPLKAPEIEKYQQEYGKTARSPKAVQPLQGTGKKKASRTAK